MKDFFYIFYIIFISSFFYLAYQYNQSPSKSDLLKNKLESEVIPKKDNPIDTCKLDKTFYWAENGLKKKINFDDVSIEKNYLGTSWIFYDCKKRIILIYYPNYAIEDKNNELKLNS